MYISGLFFRSGWLRGSHSLALSSAQAAQSSRNTQIDRQLLQLESGRQKHDSIVQIDDLWW